MPDPLDILTATLAAIPGITTDQQTEVYLLLAPVFSVAEPTATNWSLLSQWIESAIVQGGNLSAFAGILMETVCDVFAWKDESDGRAVVLYLMMVESYANRPCPK